MASDARDDHEGLSWIELHRRHFGQAFVEELLDSFSADLRTRIADAQRSDPATWPSTVRAHLHSVRGGAQHIALDSIVAACQEGMDASTAGEGRRAFEILCSLDAMFERWRAGHLRPDSRTDG